MNFSDSAAFCASQGGKLASIDTEQNYFQTLASMGEVFANLNLARDLCSKAGSIGGGRG